MAVREILGEHLTLFLAGLEGFSFMREEGLIHPFKMSKTNNVATSGTWR